MATATPAGFLKADELYTLDEVKKRLDLTESAWRALRDAGMPVKTMGKRKYLIGQQVIEWFSRD